MLQILHDSNKKHVKGQSDRVYIIQDQHLAFKKEQKETKLKNN